MTVTIKKSSQEVAGIQKPESPVKKPAYRKLKRPRSPKIDWFEIRENYVLAHMDGVKITHEEIAKKYHISVSAVRNQSAKDKWTEQVSKRIADRDNRILAVVEDTNKKAFEVLQDDFVSKEVEVRRRHAKVARLIQTKATKKLLELDMKQVSTKDAIAMLRLGLEEERHALGMPTVYVNHSGTGGGAHPEYKPLIEQFGEHSKVQEMSLELLRAMKARIGITSIEDAKILKQVGLGE